MEVSENSGFSPQIIHLFIGFSMIFTIHFGVPPFLETPILYFFWFNPRMFRVVLSITGFFAIFRAFFQQTYHALWLATCWKIRFYDGLAPLRVSNTNPIYGHSFWTLRGLPTIDKNNCPYSFSGWYKRYIVCIYILCMSHYAKGPWNWLSFFSNMVFQYLFIWRFGGCINWYCTIC